MRIVLELTKNADPNFVLRDLYKRTPMQTTFSINLLALVDGEPRTLTLKQALRVYVEHRLDGHQEARGIRSGKGQGAGAHPRGISDRTEESG
jgi:DNA gyrase/topoisomerase IV subunit A